jgi:hypothetical protein
VSTPVDRWLRSRAGAACMQRCERSRTASVRGHCRGSVAQPAVASEVRALSAVIACPARPGRSLAEVTKAVVQGRRRNPAAARRAPRVGGPPSGTAARRDSAPDAPDAPHLARAWSSDTSSAAIERCQPLKADAMPGVKLIPAFPVSSTARLGAARWTGTIGQCVRTIPRGATCRTCMRPGAGTAGMEPSAWR